MYQSVCLFSFRLSKLSVTASVSTVCQTVPVLDFPGVHTLISLHFIVPFITIYHCRLLIALNHWREGLRLFHTRSHHFDEVSRCKRSFTTAPNSLNIVQTFLNTFLFWLVTKASSFCGPLLGLWTSNGSQLNIRVILLCLNIFFCGLRV